MKERRDGGKTGPLIQSGLPANTCLCDVYFYCVNNAGIAADLS